MCRYLFILCLGLNLSGCTAMLLGGAPAGGYQVAKDERSAGQVAKDGSTTAAIKSRLIADKTVNALAVNVDTYAGKVTLNGTVGSYVARDQAQRLAKGVDGVVAVDNRLKVSK